MIGSEIGMYSWLDIKGLSDEELITQSQSKIVGYNVVDFATADLLNSKSVMLIVAIQFKVFP
jgi:hypothetical protein